MRVRIMSRSLVLPFPQCLYLFSAALLSALLPLSAYAADGDNDSSAGGRVGDIRIEAPTSGWRNSSIDPDPQNVMQDVHYPSSDVNTREGQSRFALIAGQVRLAPKPKATRQAASGASASPQADADADNGAAGTPPDTLIVNGVAMPLKVDETGHFSRPYAFGRGANNVEVRSADGQHRSVAQFYEANPNQLPAQVRVVLSWNTDQTDLDLHVITPDGQHCFYGNRVLDNGAALDVDVTSGYGPEIFESPVAQPGRYYVYVNYYGGQGMNVKGKPAVITVATVTVISHENTVNEKKQTFVVPMRTPGDLTLVSSFVE
jgi:uncharacterized protein YfaP (DUF2135 family)